MVWHSSHTSVWLGRDIRALNPPTGQDDEQLHVEPICSRDSTAVHPREAATTALDARALRLLARRDSPASLGMRYRSDLPGLLFHGQFYRVFPLMRRFRRAVAAAAMMSAVGVTDAQPRPVVVELFTSQGCSSCPPADFYLGKLSARSDVLALAFHVDYWDNLGWRDRFALPQSVKRQNVYAQNLHRSSVYTPQLVVDGREDEFRSDSKAVDRALNQNRDGVPVGLSVQDAHIQVEIGRQSGVAPCDVVLVAYLRHAVSNIGRGENVGRTLEEFNIVRDIRTLGHWKGEPRSFRVPVSSLPPDATDVAVLVQPLGQAPIVGAGMHALR